MKLSIWLSPTLAVLMITLCLPGGLHAQTITREFSASGVTEKAGGYRPITSVMDQEADIVKVAPDDLQSPRYGLLKLGDKTWAYLLDERENADAALYVDTNGDGDLTNDPKAQWVASEQGEFQMYNGSAEIELADGETGAIKLYRFDPNDERRKSLKNKILFYTDFGYEYTFQLDGREFNTFVSGAATNATRFSVDRDENGSVSRRFEMVKFGEAFNFTGTTYVFKLIDGKVKLEEADEELDVMPMPPNLEIGQQALEFVAETMTGDEIRFPRSYAGKIVMLDFWATWCRPCIGEIPHMKEAYANWHEEGFDILGISFDRADMEDEIEAFLDKNEQSWPQIYEGKRWETELGTMHDVSGIPFVLLVDGDTGEILANAKQLRGSKLSGFIQRQLEKKLGKKLALPIKEPAKEETGKEESETPEKKKDADPKNEASEKASEK